jgi:competence protein ComEC
VTRIRAPSWCATTIVDADDLGAHGVHWLRWNYVLDSFEVRPAIGSLERPWRIKP